ncbi:MAG: SDR family oxidoreductase [Actinobacteria bacterium]|nr:SDR family oxidoreductase [Actinomycetota bacterium]
MELRLDGEVAVVTGAAGGIGQGVASAMVEAGAGVALLDRDPAGLRAVSERIGANGKVTHHPVDVRDPAAVHAAIAAATETLGDPTVLVTAAAIDKAVNVVDLEIDVWREMLDINLSGTFFCLKAVIPGMLRRGRGRVIMFGSNIALKGGEEISPYGAAKAGVHGLARCAAIDLAPHKINVNVIAPGPVDTEMLYLFPDEWLAKKRGELLTGDFGRVDQIVPTVILLASEAGSFYTGSTLNVSGGDVLQ